MEKWRDDLCQKIWKRVRGNRQNFERFATLYNLRIRCLTAPVMALCQNCIKECKIVSAPDAILHCVHYRGNPKENQHETTVQFMS